MLHVYLILLPSALLVIVEHIFSDVLPLAVVCRHMVHTFLQSLVSPPAGVEKQAQHQHWGVPESRLTQSKNTSLGVNELDNGSGKWSVCVFYYWRWNNLLVSTYADSADEKYLTVNWFSVTMICHLRHISHTDWLRHTAETYMEEKAACCLSVSYFNPPLITVDHNVLINHLENNVAVGNAWLDCFTYPPNRLSSVMPWNAILLPCGGPIVLIYNIHAYPGAINAWAHYGFQHISTIYCMCF